MDSTFFLRQLDIADPSKFKDRPITVIGAGGNLFKEDQAVAGLADRVVPGV